MNEIWKDVEGYEGLYQVSNTGKVKRCSRKSHNQYGVYDISECELSQRLVSRRNSGYWAVNLWDGNKSSQKYVHRLMAIAFIENTDNNKKYVNHIDGDSHNNSLDNLEWCTHSENIKHAYANGLINQRRGSHRKDSKLSEDDVRDIKKRLSENESVMSIAKDYPVSRMCLYSIKNGQSWKHVV